MATTEELKHLHAYGYDSGSVLRRLPDRQRRGEERVIGGSYRRFFMEAVRPHLEPGSTVLELGPGRGSWTRALLRYVTQGTVHTVDLLDVTPWLQPERHDGRLVCHQADDSSFSMLDDGSIDLFFSFGVLCHNTVPAIGEIMRGALPKMRPGGIAVHEYGDWHKLERLGWTDDRHGVPAFCRELPDEHPRNCWPRNDPDTMAAACSEAGWVVEAADLGLFRRDSVIRLRAPER
jgi:SAM-dependent methyltransferase